MACCAFAVVLVSQILAALGTLLRFAPWRPRGDADEASINPATAWQLHPVGAYATAPPSAARPVRRPLRAALVLALGLELVIGAGAAVGYVATRDEDHAQLAGLDPTWLCRSTPSARTTDGER
jgi:hypothetical protein